MSAGNWIALIAVMVALVSNGVTLWLGTRRLKLDRLMADREVAGEILDEAVLRLRRVLELVSRIDDELWQHTHDFFDDEQREGLFYELESFGVELNPVDERIRFRFQRGAVTDSFRRCMDEAILFLQRDPGDEGGRQPAAGSRPGA